MNLRSHIFHRYGLAVMASDILLDFPHHIGTFTVTELLIPLFLYGFQNSVHIVSGFLDTAAFPQILILIFSLFLLSLSIFRHDLSLQFKRNPVQKLQNFFFFYFFLREKGKSLSQKFTDFSILASAYESFQLLLKRF